MKSKSYKSNHALEILTKLNKERKSSKTFCDVTLTAGAGQVNGHKCLLGMFSKFFLKMFTSDMKEKYENKAHFPEINEETLDAVLDYIYTGDIVITSENVYNLIGASNYLQIPKLKQFCVEFLLDIIDASNCLSIQAYSKLYNLNELSEKVNDVIADNFEAVCKEVEFYELKLEEVVKILQLEKNKLVHEETIFFALIDWIKHEPSDRKQYLFKLFSQVKLENLSLDFLHNTVREEVLVMDSKECLKMCFDRLLSKSMAEKRSFDNENEFIAISQNSIIKYEVSQKKLYSLPSPLHVHDFGPSVFHNGKLYLVGGNNSEVLESLNLKPKIHQMKWTILSSCKFFDNRGASCVLNNCIYYYGSWKRENWGQCYEIVNDRWINMNIMNKGRSHFALVAAEGFLYAIGGLDTNGHTLNTGECSNPEQNVKWKFLPFMKMARHGLAAVFLNDSIYAIGGNSGTQNLKCVERFDLPNETWSNVANLNVPRSGHGACVLDGKIYVAGGGSPVVEVYDTKLNTWKVEAHIQELQFAHCIIDI